MVPQKIQHFNIFTLHAGAPLPDEPGDLVGHHVLPGRCHRLAAREPRLRRDSRWNATNTTNIVVDVLVVEVHSAAAEGYR